MDLVLKIHRRNSPDLQNFFLNQKNEFLAFKKYSSWFSYIFDRPKCEGMIFELQNYTTGISVGSACIHHMDTDIQFFLVYIAPEFRGRGYGRHLINNVCQWKSQYSTFAWCLPSDASLSFYQRTKMDTFNVKAYKRFLAVVASKRKRISAHSLPISAEVHEELLKEVFPSAEADYFIWRLVHASDHKYHIIFTEEPIIMKVFHFHGAVMGNIMTEVDNNESIEAAIDVMACMGVKQVSFIGMTDLILEGFWSARSIPVAVYKNGRDCSFQDPVRNFFKFDGY